MFDSADPAITERELDASPPAVWEAIVNPERLAEWLGATIEIGDGDNAELRPGDEGTIRFDDDGDESFVLIEEVEPEHRLAFRWASPKQIPTEVSIELTPTRSGTRILIVEQPLPFGRTSRHVASSLASWRPPSTRPTNSVFLAPVSA